MSDRVPDRAPERFGRVGERRSHLRVLRPADD
jgi:hypothetical protein